MRSDRTATQIREEFLDFFREKEHVIVSSSSIVPHNDPTLLFINAGMNQFKDVFLGEGERPYRRAADSQKCLRVSGKHNDLEEVGYDTYHHTFFEMLGNWSFGDYFKKEAIAWAWELLVDRWEIDPDRLYATIHAGDAALGLEEDHEAGEFWKKYLPESRVLKGSSKYNFWMMGDTGPCGPCSEVHVDLRSEEERQRVPGSTLVNKDDPRVIELWNLVFIQYNAYSDGTLELLADKHVDTGMGLERLVAVLQGKESNYDTDIFTPLLQRIAALSPLEEVHGYDDIRDAEKRETIRVAMRVVADHIRAIVFATCDGAPPGNVGRGYVIRRILRRAARYGYQVLGFRDPFLFRLVAPLVAFMGEQFPELLLNRERIEHTIQAEEQSFLQTLGKGMAFFERILPYLKDPNAQLHQDAKTKSLLQKAGVGIDTFLKCARRQQMPGEVAFLLHDTYGFPIDLTQRMAHEEGLHVDMERYEECMQEQRDRARSASSVLQNILLVDYGQRDRARSALFLGWTHVTPGEDSEFVGYEQTNVEGATIRRLKTQEPYSIILDRTPFYAEGGGQVGDTGWLRIGGEGGERLRVLDTKKEDGHILHVVEVLPSAEGLAQMPVVATVDRGRREAIARHHTATHLLHAALREILGPHVVQKGSLVAEDHLRFDFSHYARVSPEQQQEVQDRVNEVIQRNIPAVIEVMSYERAVRGGAMALFGEKYGDEVRVVMFASDDDSQTDPQPVRSRELCGGIHVGATGELGLFLLRSEGSVAAGIRRVEALTGNAALTMVRKEFKELERVRRHLRGRQQDPAKAVADLVDRAKRQEKEVERLHQENLVLGLDSLLHQAQTVGTIRLIAGPVKEGTDMKTLRAVATTLRDRLGSGSVGVLGSLDMKVGKVYLAATVSDDLIDRGLKAGALVKQLAQHIGGGGGGRPDVATAGGSNPSGLDKALEAAAAFLHQMQS